MFHFTIRDILWLTVIVAVGLAGLVAYSTALTENGRLREIIDSQESTILELNKSVDLLLKPQEPSPEVIAPRRGKSL